MQYWISSCGRIKSVYTKSGKFIIRSGCKTRRGYRHCALGWIHRLVAKAFIPNPLQLPEVDHIDGNPSNNNVENLRWCDHKENMANLVTRRKMWKYEDDRIIRVIQQFDLNGVLIKEWKSISAVAVEFGVTRNRLSFVFKRENPIWRGFKWVKTEKHIPRYKT